METTTAISKDENSPRLSPLMDRMSYSTRSRRRVVLLGIGTVVMAAFYTASWVPWDMSQRHGAGPGDVSKEGPRDFSWGSITPSTKLTYHPCYSGYQCARLSVPLDHIDSTNPNQAHIAIVKLPAAIPESDPSWGGPILLNPGGPGGSGVAFALQVGSAIQKIVGGKYSIISFDPRGVNNTIPQISCFAHPVERKVWHVKSGGRVLNSTGESGLDSQLVELGEFYARAAILARRCNEENGQNVAYLGTPSTARDMRIIKAAEWEGKVDNKGRPRTKGLQYWGFSYGSVLGITYAAMFPDDVERIVVDGVVKPPDYYAIGWNTNLYDTDTVMDSFYEYCSLAGPLRCFFHTGKTPQDVRGRLERLLDSVKRDPIPAVLRYQNGAITWGNGLQPDLITYSDLKNIIFIALYQPLTRFPILARLLAAVETRSPTALADYAAMFDIKPLITCPASSPPDTGSTPPSPPDDLHAREATPAILCGDGTPIPSTMTPRDFLGYISELRKQSTTSGDVWSQIRLSCVGWNGQAKEKPPSILTQPTAPPPGKRLKPRNPVLLVSTDRDPATPVRNAWEMKDWFEDGKAGVLVQEGVGHCSVNSPSECAAAKLRAYFDDGKVPKGEAGDRVKGEGWCEMHMRPFLGRIEAQGHREGEGLAESMEAVGRVVAHLGSAGLGF
ncbi:TAP-like protein-domain-containing protein [Tirmania nivea]|nr:TAP-like protein-domain-containing protein [Tirmania nivea]